MLSVLICAPICLILSGDFMDFDALFPAGINHYIAGGLFIGMGVTFYT